MTASDPTPRPSVDRAVEHGALRTEADGDAARPAADVFARIPWDGRRCDPETMSAARFLGTLRG